MNAETLRLDPRDYRGGVALWGAMPPVLNTSAEPLEQETGVHVHAREVPGGRKQIDETFDRVLLTMPNGRNVLVDGDAAKYYSIGEILRLPLAEVICHKCASPIFDQGDARIFPSCSHRCDLCGTTVYTDSETIANPLMLVRRQLGARITDTIVAPREWQQSLSNWTDGVQLWGTNRAILWTAERPEHSGIHVHAFQPRTSKGRRITDETFSKVVIDGHELDPVLLRYLMAQLAAPELKSHLDCVYCEHCNFPIFTKRQKPSKVHSCDTCGKTTQTERLVLSNPLLRTIEQLVIIAGAPHGNR